MFSTMQWDTQTKPAPQSFTTGELLTIAKLLKEAGMGEQDETYVKIRILADYSIKRATQGRSYISIQAQ